MEGEMWGNRERNLATFFKFVEKKAARQWFSGASLTSIAGLCVDTGVFRRYKLVRRKDRGTSRSRR